MRRTFPMFLVASFLLLPFFTHAFPFGGRASTVLQCVYNSTIYANLGPPRGGEYIWTTATKTYQFGPPAYAGQWLLGLAGAPYYCIYRISPLTIYTGIAITMMGSSGSAAPPAPPQTGPSLGAPSGTSPSPSPTPSGGGTGSGSGSAGRVLISEVYYYVDDARGSKPGNEWVEIYNGTQATVDISGWTIGDNTASTTIPSGSTVLPREFALVTPSATTRDRWLLPSTVKFIFTGKIFGDGLLLTGDRVVLRNTTGTAIDSVSWGSDISQMQPAVPAVAFGESTTRKLLTNDTNTATDWAARSPSPGN